MGCYFADHEVLSARSVKTSNAETCLYDQYANSNNPNQEDYFLGMYVIKIGWIMPV